MLTVLKALETVAGHNRVRGLRWALARVAMSAVAEALCFAMLVPTLIAALTGRFPEALWWAAAFALSAALAFVAERWSLRSLRRQSTEVVSGLHHRIGDHVAAMPLGWFSAAHQDLLQRLISTGATSLATVLSGVVSINVRAAALAVAVAVVMAFIDPVVAGVCLAGLLLLAAMYLFATRILRRANQESTAASQKISAELLEFGQKQPVLRAYGRLGSADTELRRAIDRSRRASRDYFAAAITGATAFALGSALTFAAAVLVVADRADAATVGPAIAVVLVLFVGLLVDAVAALGRTGSVIWAAESDVNEMARLLQTPTLPEPERSAPVQDTSIAFDNVAFGYGGPPIVERLSFTVPSGRTCAVVGPSGSGKTTLVRLAARFFDVAEGAVRVGGADVRELRSADLMNQLAVVFQDVYLFDGTIAENVTMGRAATDEQLRIAAQRSRLDEVIERLPDGWDTQVGDRGTALSGGERQRVSIARAMVKDAPIVLLDEATSALDAENEQAVRAALTQLGRGRTTLVVAHRLATVRHADLIVFLEGGRAAEMGTHDELLALGGRYASFWAEHDQVT